MEAVSLEEKDLQVLGFLHGFAKISFNKKQLFCLPPFIYVQNMNTSLPQRT